MLQTLGPRGAHCSMPFGVSRWQSLWVLSSAFSLTDWTSTMETMTTLFIPSLAWRKLERSCAWQAAHGTYSKRHLAPKQLESFIWRNSTEKTFNVMSTKNSGVIRTFLKSIARRLTISWTRSSTNLRVFSSGFGLLCALLWKDYGTATV